jgi:hypothetical protein
MTARQTFSVKKLAPYSITETVYKAQKDASGKHLGFDRTEKERLIKDGRLVMFASGHSVRIEGGDEAVKRLMAGHNPLVTPESVKQATLTPEQAVERVLARSNPVVEAD